MDAARITQLTQLVKANSEHSFKGTTSATDRGRERARNCNGGKKNRCSSISRRPATNRPPTRLTSLIEIFRQITFRFLCAPPFLPFLLSFLIPFFLLELLSFLPSKRRRRKKPTPSLSNQRRRACSHALSEWRTPPLTLSKCSFS